MDMTTDPTTWRVLVVDDEPDNVKLALDVLEFAGAKAAQAGDGKQGLALVDEFKPNLILLDLAMPEMDGWEMHRVLRSRPDTRHLPVIALTALAMPDDADRVKQAGFTAYVTKPFRVRELITHLQKAVSAALAAAAAAPPPPADQQPAQE